MAESNNNGGPSSDGVDFQRRQIDAKRSREADEAMLLNKLRASCQLLKGKVDAQRKAKKPAKPPKMAIYEKSDPFGRKAKRNARQRENYRIRKEKSVMASHTLTVSSADSIVSDYDNVDVGEVLYHDVPDNYGRWYSQIV